MRLIPSLLLGVALFATMGCHSSHVSVHASFENDNEKKEVTEKRFKADKIQSVKVISGAGDIIVQTNNETGNSEQTLLIRAEKQVSGNGGDKALINELNALKPTAQLVGSTLVIETKVASESGSKAEHGVVNYTLTVPKRIALDLESASGDIKASDTKASVTVKSASGSIRLAGIEGSIIAETASGDLTLHSVTHGQTVRATSQSGEVKADEMSVETYEASSVSGSNEFTGKVTRLNLTTTSGDLTFSLSPGTVAQEVQAASVSGSVSAFFAKETKGSLTLETVTGELDTTDLTPNRNRDEEPHQLTLPLNGGGTASFHLKTTSGDIKAEARK